MFSLHRHLGRRDCHPFISVRLEPRQAQGIPAIEIGVLTVTEPPSTPIVSRTVGGTNVHIAVLGAECHAILIRQRIGRVARVTGHMESITGLLGVDRKMLILGAPVYAVGIDQINS